MENKVKFMIDFFEEFNVVLLKRKQELVCYCVKTEGELLLMMVGHITTL